MKVITLLVALCLICSLRTFAQGDGVTFNQELTWDQVLSKAKKENKYVFVDCNASWCLPCKKMEKEVFAQKSVGDFMNPRFISIRVQMDTSKNDDESVKKWYQDAHRFLTKFKIGVYPTYLFFSPDGQVVHRYISAIPETEFLKIAKNALDPEKQYYTLLGNYLKGRKNYERLPYLIVLGRYFKEDSMVHALSADYLHNYLNKLPEKELLQKKYLDFVHIGYSALGSGDKLFDLMFRKGELVDQIEGEDKFSRSTIQYVISKEEVKDKLPSLTSTENLSPEFWDQLRSIIEKKYNAYYAGRVVSEAQVKWYQQKKDRAQYIKYKTKQIDEFGLDTAGIGWALVNNFAWNYVFKYCNSKDTLNKAIGWMETVLKGHPDDFVSIDTYANLLFKTGRKNEAITWEEKAIDLEKKAAQKENREPDKSFQETLDKIKGGIPTWAVK